MKIDTEREELASRLRGSLLEFTRFFFKHITRRDFIVSCPEGRESHHITVSKALTKLHRLETPEHRLIINLPPGFGKSVLVSNWVAWSLAQYPDSNFLYISYAHELAAKHTAFIKSIVSSEIFAHLFGVGVKRDSRAKDHFVTTAGGTVRAFGAAGAVTGSDAGLPGLNRFSGAVIIDDPIKPDAGHSDTVRKSVIKNYDETIRQRPRGINVPMVFIGQRVHEDDLANHLISGKDINSWSKVILKSLDSVGNALYPDIMSAEKLKLLEKRSPYVFASQYQQDPLPAGGGIFKKEWISELDEYPEITNTFITADTAETSKSYNDATVFSFWGIYEIESYGRKTGVIGLHWIDCVELRIEPKDLKDGFLDFWQECCRFNIAPSVAAIEKKSTGVTLVSVLDDIRGISIKDIGRTSASGSKTERFLRTQPYLASKQVSINRDARHKELVLEHISKITANDTHRHDDIADTLADAVNIALAEKLLAPTKAPKHSGVAKQLNESLKHKMQIRKRAYGSRS